jgi:hypothetical protein
MMLRRNKQPLDESSKSNLRLTLLVGIATGLLAFRVALPLAEQGNTFALPDITTILGNTYNANRMCSCSGSKPTCSNGKEAFCTGPLKDKDGTILKDCYWACPCDHGKQD